MFRKQVNQWDTNCHVNKGGSACGDLYNYQAVLCKLSTTKKLDINYHAPLYLTEGWGLLSDKLYSSYAHSFTPVGTEPPSNVAARQTNPTSILVEWTPSSDATGYIIHYDSSGDPSGSVSIDGGSTNSHTLENFRNGETYTMSVVATSANLLSQVVTADMAVGLGKI